jgi:hypothetical protein
MSNHHPNQRPNKTGLAAYQASRDARGWTVSDMVKHYSAEELRQAGELLDLDMQKLEIALSVIHKAIIAKGIEHERN